MGELRQGKLYEKQLQEWTDGVEAKVLPLLKEAMAGDHAGPGMGRMAVAHYREMLDSIGR